jgi:hypothetical protein
MYKKSLPSMRNSFLKAFRESGYKDKIKKKKNKKKKKADYGGVC